MLNGQKYVAQFRQWSDPKLLDHFDETEQKLTTRPRSPNISLIRRQAEKRLSFLFLFFIRVSLKCQNYKYSLDHQKSKFICSVYISKTSRIISINIMDWLPVVEKIVPVDIIHTGGVNFDQSAHIEQDILLHRFCRHNVKE